MVVLRICVIGMVLFFTGELIYNLITYFQNKNDYNEEYRFCRGWILLRCFIKEMYLDVLRMVAFFM
jgi:hypothetical protein